MRIWHTELKTVMSNVPENGPPQQPVKHEASHDAPRRSAVVSALTITVIALMAITACGSSSSSQSVGAQSPASTNASAASGTRRAVDALLAGIPQTGNVLGSQKAPVTLEYFSDVSCPASREIMTGPLASIIRGWVRPGRLRIEFRSLEEGSEPLEVFTGLQVDALAAGVQNKLWLYLEYFYRAFEGLSSNYRDTCYLPNEGFAQTVAREVPGLDYARWTADQHDPSLASEVAADQRVAAHAKLGQEPFKVPHNQNQHYQNPAYLIGRTGARTVTKLAEFSHAEPAYAEVARMLIAAKVQGG